MQERFGHFTCAIQEISRFWRKLAAEEMEKHGLKAAHAVYFAALAQHAEDGMTASQLCDACGKDKADVSRMLTIMEQRGFLRKEGSAKHLYNGVFKLTEAGLRLADYVERRSAMAMDLAGRELSETDRERLYFALDSIAAQLRELSRTGLPDHMKGSP